MEDANEMMNYGGSAWFWIVIILLFAGGGNGLFGNNSTNNQINSDFLYRDIANVNDNVLQNRYDNALQTNQLQAQMTTNTQMILDKMCQNEIQNLRDQLQQKDLLLAQSNALSISQNQTANLLSQLGRFVPYMGYGGCGCNNI